MKYRVDEIIRGQVIAHRGLWDNNIPENSLLAFKEALNKGIDIELDVHRTRDGTLAVFHDHTLMRMCNKPKLLYFLSERKLKQTMLKGSNQYIPQLSEILDLVNGKVSLFIEIKCKFRWRKLCDAILDILKDYNGKVEFHSFNYKALQYIQSKSGYIVALSCLRPKATIKGFVPDAICANVNLLNIVDKSKVHQPIITWTINNSKQLEKAQKCSHAYMANIHKL